VTIAGAGGLARTDLAGLNRSLRRNINSARGYCPPIELAARRLAGIWFRLHHGALLRHHLAGGGPDGALRRGNRSPGCPAPAAVGQAPDDEKHQAR